MALPWEKSVLVSQTSPAFLHANSTSHTWVFSAIAEIIDNAYDPDVSASKLRIDCNTLRDETCLIFTDNGAGMTAEKLHLMLSFGYCEKVEVQGHKPVGHYGNGFKSGSMRLGKDAIVFTKHTDSMSVGFLSQNFLKKVSAKTVLVPILTFDLKTRRLEERKDTEGSLRAITQYSLFRSKEEILEEFEAIESTCGTRIIISDLKRGNDGKLELDFESDPKDIRYSDHHELDFSTNVRPVREYTPEYKNSLREYLSILFLKPRMKIIIRGHKVMTKLVSKSLSRTEKDVYKPMWQTKPIKLIFGFGPSENDYGVMMYHRNRLIKAYERVGCQKQGDGRGKGVVGVVQVDFLEPIHNKQDFNKTDRYNSYMNALAQKLQEYWIEKTNTPMTLNGVTVIEPSRTAMNPDWTWVQCDNCLKWRRLPDGFSNDSLPEKWFCYMNPDPVHSRCDVEEEPEDEDELLNRATYQKTHKNLIMKEKAQKRQSLNAKEQELKRKEVELHETAQRLQELNKPLSNVPGRDKKPTVADLEKAKQDLQRAQQREREQQQYIQILRQQKMTIEQTQKTMKNNLQGSMNILHEQASGINKRKSNAASKGAPDQKKKKTAMETEEFVVTRNDSSSSETEASSDCGNEDVILIDSDDDVETWKKKKKGKLPKISLGGKKKTSTNVDEVDVKPDVDELNANIKKDKDSPGLTISEVRSEAGKASSSKTGSVGGESKSPSRKASTSHKDSLEKSKSSTSVKKQRSQTDSKSVDGASSSTVKTSSSVQNPPEIASLKKELEKSKKSLTSLRKNVRELLKVIVPDLEVKDLTYIDDIVLEMIKVNSQQNGEDNGQTNHVENDSNESSKISNSAAAKESTSSEKKSASSSKKTEISEEVEIKEEPSSEI